MTTHPVGIDAVVHLAALSYDPLGNLAPTTTYSINLDASVRLAEAAKAAGVGRFLYSSSCSVYGAAGGEGALDETATMNPLTPCAISKVRVEDALTELADDAFSPTYLRNATAYGFSPKLRSDLVRNNLVAMTFLTGEVRVLRNGTPWRPLVHIRDISTVFDLVLTAPLDLIHDQAFNVGAPSENYRVSELAEIVANGVPGSTIVITGEVGSDSRSYRVDFSKLSRVFPQHPPGWNAARGASELAESYRMHGLTQDDLRNRCTRLNSIAQRQSSGHLDDDLRWLE